MEGPRRMARAAPPARGEASSQIPSRQWPVAPWKASAACLTPATPPQSPRPSAQVARPQPRPAWPPGTKLLAPRAGGVGARDTPRSRVGVRKHKDACGILKFNIFKNPPDGSICTPLNKSPNELHGPNSLLLFVNLCSYPLERCCFTLVSVTGQAG